MIQIVTVAEIQRRAQAAFKQGEPATSNPYPNESAAFATWEAAFERLLVEQNLRHARAGTNSYYSHSSVGALKPF